MCDCIDQMNRKLAGQNQRVQVSMLGAVIVATTKINPQRWGSQDMLLASHCPFCGQTYETVQPQERVRAL